MASRRFGTQKVWELFSGLDENPSIKIADLKASLLQNLLPIGSEVPNRLVCRSGYISSGSIDGTPDGMEWAKLGELEILAASINGDIVDLFGSTLSGGIGRFTPALPVSFAWIENKLYAGNGQDQNVRIDASGTVAQVLPDPPSGGNTVGLIEIGTGTGNLNSTTGNPYIYKFTFASFDGNDSEASDETSGIAVSHAIGIQGFNLPLVPTGQDITAIRLWRTGGSITDFRFVEEFSISTTGSFLDQVEDGDLGRSFDEDAVRMPPCGLLETHLNRIFGSNNFTQDAGQSTMFASRILQPWYIDIINLYGDAADPIQGAEFTLQGRAAGKITGLKSFGSYLVMFMGGAGYMLEGDNPSDFRTWTNTAHGCTSNRSIKQIGTSIYWLSNDGIYAWVNTQPVQRISQSVNISLSPTERAQCHAYVGNKPMGGQLYVLCLPQSGLVYDPQFDTWTTFTNWQWDITASSVFTSNEHERVFAIRDDTLFELENGSTDNGSSIPIDFATKDLDFGFPFNEKRVQYYSIACKVGTGTISGSLYIGTGELIQQEAMDISSINRSGANTSKSIFMGVDEARDDYFRLRIEGDISNGLDILQCALAYSLLG